MLRCKQSFQNTTYVNTTKSNNMTQCQCKNKSKHCFIFHITGYGKFGNVLNNPSQHIIENLKKNEYLKRQIYSLHIDNIIIGSLNVMTVRSKKTKKELQTIRDKNEFIKKQININPSNVITIYLHFGLSGNRKYFSLETTAYNKYNNNKSKKIKMIRNDTKNELNTSLPINKIASVLSSNYSYNIKISHNPGTYICNWIYFWSLYYTKQNKNDYSLFVHVPKDKNIQQQKIQTQFAKDLVIIIANTMTAQFNNNSNNNTPNIMYNYNKNHRHNGYYGPYRYHNTYYHNNTLSFTLCITVFVIIMICFICGILSFLCGINTVLIFTMDNNDHHDNDD